MKDIIASIRDFWYRISLKKTMKMFTWLQRRKMRVDGDTTQSTTYIALGSLVESSGNQSELFFSLEERSCKLNHYTHPVLLSNDQRQNSSDILEEPECVDVLLRYCCENRRSLQTPVWPQRAVDRSCRNTYERTRDKLLRSISYSYKLSIIAWCPFMDTRCQSIDSMLSKFGKVISIHDRWIPDEFHAYSDSWGGVIVIYETENMAKTAAKDIPAKHNFIRTLTLSKLLRCLIKSELTQPNWGTGRTEIAVLGGGSDAISLHSLKLLLLKFGDVISIDFHDPSEDTAILCEVSYSYACHAYLAMTVLDGMPFGSSVLTVVVRETLKEKKILNSLLSELEKYNDNTHFPFKGLF